MDYTALAATVDYSNVLTFLTAVVAATFTVRVALKGVSMAKAALSRG